MHQTAGMYRLQCFDQASGQPPHRRLRQGSRAGNHFGQRRAGHEDCGQPGGIIAGACRHDGCGVCAADCSGCLYLAPEPANELRVAGELPMDDLHCHRPARGGETQEDQAPARPRRPHQRIRAGRVDAQVKTSDTVPAPHRPSPHAPRRAWFLTYRSSAPTCAAHRRPSAGLTSSARGAGPTRR